MEEGVLGKYRKAGKAHAEIREIALGRMRVGMKLIEIAELIEKAAQERGLGLAFPVNTSLNDIAAHYTPAAEDPRTVEEGDLLKVDFGVHADGYIADGAFTFPQDSELFRAGENAIREAVKVIRPGAEIGDVSRAIEESVMGEGFGVIVNLTGHGLGRNVFHGPPSIPNISTGSKVVLEEGQAIALEPFVTEKNGHVKESSPSGIYRVLQEKNVRLMEGRRLLSLARERHGDFPFAKRWFARDFPPVMLSLALRQLESAGALEAYPPLREISGQRIAQAEHTIIVMDKPVVTTML